MPRAALTALAVLCASRLAAADSDDLVMSRLGTTIVDGNGQIVGAVGENLEFRALASQLGVALAPHLLSPADTLGFAGFQFDVDASQTTIDVKQPYWRVLAGTPDPSGMNRVAHGAGFLRTLGMYAHKGLLPAFEVGAGAIHLLDSATWTIQAYAKLGLHEGYHDLPTPSVSLRGALSKMLNERDLDLTVASIDLTVSKHFAFKGAWRIDPFVGADVLLIIPRSNVFDATPNVDPLRPGNDMDATNNFVFKDQSVIRRNRLLAGAKLQYDIIQVTVEAELALAGSTADSTEASAPACQPRSTTINCQASDTAAAQTTVSLSAGFDF